MVKIPYLYVKRSQADKSCDRFAVLSTDLPLHQITNKALTNAGFERYKTKQLPDNSYIHKYQTKSRFIHDSRNRLINTLQRHGYTHTKTEKGHEFINGPHKLSLANAVGGMKATYTHPAPASTADVMRTQTNLPDDESPIDSPYAPSIRNWTGNDDFTDDYTKQWPNFGVTCRSCGTQANLQLPALTQTDYLKRKNSLQNKYTCPNCTDNNSPIMRDPIDMDGTTMVANVEKFARNQARLLVKRKAKKRQSLAASYERAFGPFKNIEEAEEALIINPNDFVAKNDKNLPFGLSEWEGRTDVSPDDENLPMTASNLQNVLNPHKVEALFGFGKKEDYRDSTIFQNHAKNYLYHRNKMVKNLDKMSRGFIGKRSLAKAKERHKFHRDMAIYHRNTIDEMHRQNGSSKRHDPSFDAYFKNKTTPQNHNNDNKTSGTEPSLNKKPAEEQPKSIKSPKQKMVAKPPKPATPPKPKAPPKPKQPPAIKDPAPKKSKAPPKPKTIKPKTTTKKPTVKTV